MAVTLNWRNDKQGYWMNGTLIAFADIPFVLFVLVPGLIPWWPGLAGPVASENFIHWTRGWQRIRT
jgi:hypothetical protein